MSKKHHESKYDRRLEGIHAALRRKTPDWATEHLALSWRLGYVASYIAISETRTRELLDMLERWEMTSE